MSRWRLSCYALKSWVALALLVGCGGSQPPIGAPGAMPRHAIGAHAAHGKSWMARDAKNAKELLYISDIASNDVFVYNYKTGAQVGQLTGFNYPQGQCVDKRGDVWIANFANGGTGTSVVEYAHGGINPIATLLPQGYPIGCSIDPITGNLAVANRFTPGSEPGDIEVWENAFSNPTTYKNNSCGLLTSPGYDDKGNLYVMGTVNGHPPDKLCEIPAGATALELTSVANVAIHDAEGVMWDGKFVTLSDSNPYDRSNSGVTAIYQAAPQLAGSGLIVVGTTILVDSCFHGEDDTYVQQPFIVGKKNTPQNHEEGSVVIGGNIDCSARFDFWHYPGGTYPFFSLKSSPQNPQGQSVSIAE